MNTPRHLFPVAILLAGLSLHAQQSPNPQPPSTQAQTTPCVSVQPTAQKPQGDSLSVKPPTKWQQYLDTQRKALAAKYGLILPATPAQLSLIPKPVPQPCPPQTIAAVPALKLPPDTTVTLHCNPMTPSSKDSAHPTTLTLSDPHDFEVPKPGELEADSVVPDMAAKTPCYLIKVDPKSGKPFVTQ